MKYSSFLFFLVLLFPTIFFACGDISRDEARDTELVLPTIEMNETKDSSSNSLSLQPAGVRNDQVAKSVDEIDIAQLRSLLKMRKSQGLFLYADTVGSQTINPMLPRMVALNTEYKNRMEFLFLAIDASRGDLAKIPGLIEKFNIPFRVKAMPQGKPGNVLPVLGGGEGGTLPATFIYYKSRQKVKRIEGVKETGEYKKILESVLSGS